jgi:uncharacterized protein (TIGR02145 family)
VAAINTNLQAGSNTFELSLARGIYLIQVTGNEYAYTAKLLNQTGTQSNPGIVYTGTDKPTSSGPQKTKSSTLGVTAMTYTAGDQLLYKAVSGNYSTIVTDVPTGDKTTNFNFVACTDADGNNYTVVTIGTQTWMAENLKTTKYNDGSAIPNVTDNTWATLITGAYCWYNNDAATYKDTYGALYNWYTINRGNLAPTGWHVSTDAEWTTLGNYLTANGYNYDGSTSGNFYAKSLAATTNWTTDPTFIAGTIGNDLSKNNSTGFSALPGGWRSLISGLFTNYGGHAITSWWSSTESGTSTAWERQMDVDNSSLTAYSIKSYDGNNVRCVRNPVLTTIAASSVTTTTATSGGNITDDGGATIIARGICWSTSANPTIADSITTDGTGAGTFTSALTGLTANTTYNVRAYATKSAGTAYGNQVSFTTNSGDTITDLDGNVYHTVNIGTQTWMIENLKTTRYNDGTAIPTVTDNNTWSSLTIGAYCWYNNDSTTYKNLYGALYNWYTVNTGKLAPIGWHVPTDSEWTTLENYLLANGYNYDGSTSGNFYAKSLAATTNWTTDTGSIAGTIGNDLSKNNSTGFSALPGSYRGVNGFSYGALIGFWWSSTEGSTSSAWSRYLYYGDNSLYRGGISKNFGFSVRCVKDN